MYNGLVQTLWIDSVLGEHQKVCLKSFLDRKVEVHLYSYQTQIGNLPKGIRVMDANLILDRKLIFRDKFNSYATFSDWFRIKLLFDRGGWWVDSDMLCIKPFDFDCPYVFATEYEVLGQNKNTVHICNCVLKMPSSSDIGAAILEHITRQLSIVPGSNIEWTEIGAQLLTTELVGRNMLEYAVNPEVFCPFGFTEFKSIFTQPTKKIKESTFGIHLWNKMWEWNKLNPVEQICEDSIFSKFS